MRHITRMAAVAALCVITLAGCAGQIEEATHKAVEPYSLETYDGTTLSRVTLTESAAKRLAVTTAPVEEVRLADGAVRKAIPYAAIIYDIQGDTWTYTSPEALVFVREAIIVDHIKEDSVYLIEGPDVGTAVVTAGAAELYGIEFGLGK